jgi:hypothetical protein
MGATILFGLTVYKARQFWNQSQNQTTPILTVITRDGTIYFVIVFLVGRLSRRFSAASVTNLMILISRPQVNLLKYVPTLPAALYETDDCDELERQLGILVSSVSCHFPLFNSTDFQSCRLHAPFSAGKNIGLQPINSPMAIMVQTILV